MIRGPVVHLNIVPRLYCATRSLRLPEVHGAALAATKDLLSRDLQYLRPGDPDYYPPVPAHAQHAKAVLELCLYAANLEEAALLGMPDEKQAEMRKQDQKARDLGAKLIMFFTGAWWLTHVVHHCFGCCQSREEAIKRGHDLLCELWSLVIPSPALNKWLTLRPPATSLLLKMQLHSLYTRAYLGMDARPDDGDSSAHESQDQDGHAPANEQRAFMIARRRRARTFKEMLTNFDLTLYQLLVYVILVKQMERLHFTLFKSATHLGQGEGATLLDIINFNKSLAVKILSFLSLALDSVHPYHRQLWLPLILQWGPVTAWPQPLLDLVNQCVFMLIGSLWRRWVHEFAGFPWKLGLLVDPDVSEHMKAAVRAAFWDAPVP